VILATDCDREGQLIGQEILEHLKFRGSVQRALFTAQDPKSLQQAFAKLKPNKELRPLYDAAVARQQSDQIFNLSLTRTATRQLLTKGVKGVIGIGRVKTPTLAIVCLREIEIRDFKPDDYFEITAAAKVGSKDDAGTFSMRHAPPVKARIRDRALADAIAKAATKFTGPLAVTVEHRNQAPPKLYDLPALQKVCGQRWGWTADKTLSVAQALYDGDGKKVITYPRAESRYLAENQIADVPTIVDAMCRLRGFASLSIKPPVIRRGKSGHFCDKALEGVSHHAIVPNVNVMDDLEARIARLSDDEKRLFALICRSYLAAVMPDYEYQQTVVVMQVPVPELEPTGGPGASAEFRAVGRIPLKMGWKAAFGASEPEPERNAFEARMGDAKKGDGDTEQALPNLANGQPATLSKLKVQAKVTVPPPRYNEGTLVDVMQNAWRFVADEALRERLKEAKGIGTPATRASIITGLKRQNLLAADGKLVVPTAAGLQLFEVLRAAAPALVDPGTTAVWEMRLDDVVLGKADFRAVIDEIADEAERLIAVLRAHKGGTVDLEQKPAFKGKRPSTGRSEGKGGDGKPSAAARKPASRGRADSADDPKPKRAAAAKPRAPKAPAGEQHAEPHRGYGQPNERPLDRKQPAQYGGAKPPTEKMIAFAQKLARDKNAELPKGFDKDFETCRRFLDQNLNQNPG
jgi:DNA topoisomerase III